MVNEAELATLHKARELLSPVEIEKLAGLIHLRHSTHALVRIAANMELMPILTDLRARLSN